VGAKIRYDSILLAILAALCVFRSGTAFAQQSRPVPASNNHCVPEIEARILSAVLARNYAEAFAAANELDQVTKVRFGEDSRCYGVALSEQAAALYLLGQSKEAGPLFERALSLLREYSEPDDARLTLTLTNFGTNLYSMHRYEEAAHIQEEALELRQKHRPLDEIAVADSFQALADAYRRLNRDPKVVLDLYQKALAIKVRILPPYDVSIGENLQNLASAQELMGDLSGASRNLEQALAIYRRGLAKDDPIIAGVINRQALILFIEGANKQAEVKFREALRLERLNANTQKIALAATLDDFALNQIQLGKLEEANSLAREALGIRRAIFAENSSTIARTLSNLSYLAWLKRDYDESLRLAREASDITIGNGQSDPASRFRLQRHLFSAWSEGTNHGQSPSPQLTDEAFAIGQRVMRSDTATTVSRTALRFSERNPHLRELLKNVDDIDDALARLEEKLTHSLTLASGSATAFSDIRAEMSAKTAHRKELLGEIDKSFPDYARLINPNPVTAAAVQGLLNPDEVLVAIVVGFEDIYVWCITREQVAWRKLDLGPQELASMVGTLRAGLDVEPEDTSPEAIKQSLFDLGLANALYQKLLGPVIELTKSKSKLLVVPSGPLISLPLHLLVASKPAISTPNRNQPSAFKDADWLAKRFAISVLPSVESLDALRHRAKPTADRKPMIGFADPLPSPDFVEPKEELKVASNEPGYARGAKERRGLPASIWNKQTPDIDLLRNFLADPHHWLKYSKPELMAVGGMLGADPRDLHSGPDATETTIKLANKQGELASYRVIYFATHAYVAGAFDLSEPALALTVPKQPSEFDDGLLTASEITQLTLDADWVVLSACNTAAGTVPARIGPAGGGGRDLVSRMRPGQGAEGLSGLARAFFHAGARALLVSNWDLDDQSAMQLMEATFDNLRKDPTMGRSQAFRQAMLAQIQSAGKKDTLFDAYPGRWAAFEVVGVD
jgi:CHAT domain-containing protein